jgi:hypothetical protein
MTKRLLIGAAVIVLAVAAYFVVAMGPRNIIGMLRYDQREEGTLKVGDRAPDVDLVALDGVTPVKLSRYLGSRPVLIVFGSFT